MRCGCLHQSEVCGHGRLWPNRLWPALLADRVWPNRLWPKPTLAKSSLTCCVWCVCVFVCLCVCVFVWLCGCVVVCVCVCVVCGVGVCFTVSWSRVSRVGVGFKVLVWSCSVRPGLPFPGPPFTQTAQNFALFFSHLKIRSFPFSLGSFSLYFGGVFEGRDSQMCTFWLSGCRVKPRLHTTTRTPNAHILASQRFKHHQNSTRRPPERREKNEL